MAEGVGAIGWHGKLPSLGDFATRRLDGDFISVWDGWLSAGLATLRLAPDWPQAYLASPSWRFLLLPGVLPGRLGDQAWAGVLMPSVDRVGRYYPLSLAQPLHALPADAQGADALWTWLLRLDEAAADALHEDWTVDQLEAELLRLGQPDYAPAAEALHLNPQAAVQPLALGKCPNAAALLQAQAAVLWQQHLHGRAFWSAQPDQGPALQLSSQGLAGEALVHGLLGGRGADGAAPWPGSAAIPSTTMPADHEP